MGVTLLHAGFFPAPSWEQKWIAVFGLTLALLIASLRDTVEGIYYPKLSGVARAAAIVAVVGFVVSLGLNMDHVSWIRVAERICFFGLFLYFFNLRTRRESRFVNQLEIATYVTIAALVTGYAWYYGACRAVDPWATRCPAPFLENRNMFVQALELQLILLTLTMSRRPSISRPRLVGFAVATALALIVCVASHSRSSLMTIGLIGFVMIAGWWRVRWPIFIASLALFTVGILALIHARTELMDSSSLLRFELLKAGWRVSLRHVWGVGLGSYPWTEWRERVTPAAQFVKPLFYKSPHNEILRLAAEEGWVTAIASFVVLFEWLRRARGMDFWSRLTKVSAAAFVVCETLLQFPFENPVPSLALACVLAFIAPPGVVGALTVGRSLKMIILAMLAFLNSVVCAEFYYYRRHRDSRIVGDFDRRLCAVTPEFWPLCLRVARDLKWMNDDAAGRAVLKSMLRRDPNNVWAFAELTNADARALPTRDAYDAEVRRILAEP